MLCRVRSCCCGCTLKQGTLGIAIFSIVFGVSAFLGGIAVKNSDENACQEHLHPKPGSPLAKCMEVIHGIGVGYLLEGVMIFIAGVCLFVATQTGRRSLMALYVFLSIVYVLVKLVLIFVALIFGVWILGEIKDYMYNTTLSALIVVVGVSIFFFFLQIYFIVVVMSYKHDLGENTADDSLASSLPRSR